MGRIFLWFYCLPLVDAALLVLLATVVFLILREELRRFPGWKAAVRVLFVLWLVVLFIGTLGQRMEGRGFSQPVLMPFASYYAVLHGGTREIWRTNFMNAVLFYPAGLLGCESLPGERKGWKAALVAASFALVSIGIEYAQFRFGLGLAETDDVLHNTLGALLGAAACRFTISLRKK